MQTIRNTNLGSLEVRAHVTLLAGLLLASIADPDPVIFFEAKMLYRTVVEDVPIGSYTIPLGQARIARTGGDITLVGWGQQVAVLERAVSQQLLSSQICLLSCVLLPWYPIGNETWQGSFDKWRGNSRLVC